jgi:hypothetical protein
MSDKAETKPMSPLRRYVPTVLMVLAIGFVWFGLKEFKTPGPPPELDTTVAIADAYARCAPPSRASRTTAPRAASRWC